MFKEINDREDVMNHVGKWMAAGLMLLMLAACGNGPEKQLPKHVVMIGIDGWSDAEWEEAEMPFVKSLQQRGAWTLDKRCVIPTASAINWMTLFSGVQPEYHGYFRWNSRRPDFSPAYTDARGEVPTIFRLERDQHPESRMLVTYEWDVIRSLVDSVAVDDVVPFEQSAEGDSIEVAYAAQYFKENRPDFSLIYFGNLDHTGHEFGWKSEEYHAYLTHMDGIVKSIVEAVREAGMEEETVFVLTTDHGGWEKSHGGKYYDDVLKTPLLIWGKGIKKGYEITAPTIQMDVTATLAALLGVETPAHWTGRVMEEIFE